MPSFAALPLSLLPCCVPGPLPTPSSWLRHRSTWPPAWKQISFWWKGIWFRCWIPEFSISYPTIALALPVGPWRRQNDLRILQERRPLYHEAGLWLHTSVVLVSRPREDWLGSSGLAPKPLLLGLWSWRCTVLSLWGRRRAWKGKPMRSSVRRSQLRRAAQGWSPCFCHSETTPRGRSHLRGYRGPRGRMIFSLRTAFYFLCILKQCPPICRALVVAWKPFLPWLLRTSLSPWRWMRWVGREKEKSWPIPGSRSFQSI